MTSLNTGGRALQAWPITLEFGQVPQGATSAVQTVRLRNRSTTPVTVGAIRVIGSGIAVERGCPESLPAGGVCDLRITISPAALGPLRGAVQITSDVLATPAFVSVYGRGGAGPLSALAWQPAADTLQLDASDIAPVTRRLTLFNGGVMPVALASTSIVGPESASFQTQGCASDSVLQAGTGCEMSVTYTPNLLTAAQATLQVRSDHGNPASVLLAGTRPAQRETGPPQALPIAEGGGSCSSGPPNSRARDPLLPALVLAAAALVWVRGRSRSHAAGPRSC